MLKKWLQLLKKDERGLTLVELLAVIVILAIVGAIAFVAIGNVMENSRQDAHIANAQQLISSAKLYEAGGETISETGVDNTTLQEEGFLGALTSPWDDDTTYEGTVFKDADNVYRVTIDSDSECELTTETEHFINLGQRDALCEVGPQTTEE